MLKKSRGIKAVNFAKFFLKELKNFQVTDYSANKEAYKIFKFLNFNDLLLSKICSSFLITFSINPFTSGVNVKVSHQSVKKEFKEINSYSLSDQIEFYKFSYQNLTFTYAARERISIIPIFLGFRLKIPIIDIIWISDEVCLSRNWKLFCKTIFLQKFIFGIYCNFNHKNCPNIIKFDQIFNTKKFKKRFLTYNSKDEKLIYTLGSEMMFF